MFDGTQKLHIRRHHIALLSSDIIYRALTLVILTFWLVLDTQYPCFVQANAINRQ